MKRGLDSGEEPRRHPLPDRGFEAADPGAVVPRFLGGGEIGGVRGPLFLAARLPGGGGNRRGASSGAICDPISPSMPGISRPRPRHGLLLRPRRSGRLDAWRGVRTLQTVARTVRGRVRTLLIE
jgi:hypothetical protein